MKKSFLLPLFVSAVLVLVSCSPADFFEQPTVTVIDYELVEPPGEYTNLLMECDIKNNDTHDGDVKTVTYSVTVEGVLSENMTYSTPFTMAGGQTVRKKLPLTFVTANATSLLLKIGGGSQLQYSATGNILAGTDFGDQNLTLDVSGSADLEIDLNDFFLQPSITMDESQGFTVTNTGSPPVPIINPTGSPATVTINKTDVLNNDTRPVNVKKVVYKVNIEGAISQEMTYTPLSPIAIGAGASVSINNLPITYSYMALIAAVNFAVSGTYYVDYTITGSVLVEADLGAGTVDFYVPLNTTGINTILVSP